MRFYKLAFLEACFNKGYGVTAPLKYLVALFGISNAIATNKIMLTMIVGFAYIVTGVPSTDETPKRVGTEFSSLFAFVAIF